MGGTTFEILREGESAEQAFAIAVAGAQYDHGHAGYTGTIAEKSEFILIAPPDNWNAEELVREIQRNHSADAWAQVDDKWGPAGCVELGKGRYFFFGWASE